MILTKPTSTMNYKRNNYQDSNFNKFTVEIRGVILLINMGR